VNIYVTLLFLYLFQLNFSYLLLILEEDMGLEFVHADACGMSLSLPLISCFGKFNISTYKYLPWQKKRKLCVNIWWVGKREGGGWLYDRVRSCAHVYYVILLNYLFEVFFFLILVFIDFQCMLFIVLGRLYLWSVIIFLIISKQDSLVPSVFDAFLSQLLSLAPPLSLSLVFPSMYSENILISKWHIWKSLESVPYLVIT
jgi:hypothetical protein